MVPSPLQHFSRKLKLNFYFSFNTSWYWNCMKLIEPNSALKECMGGAQEFVQPQIKWSPWWFKDPRNFLNIRTDTNKSDYIILHFIYLTNAPWSFSLWLLAFVCSSSWEEYEFPFVGINGQFENHWSESCYLGQRRFLNKSTKLLLSFTTTL